MPRTTLHNRTTKHDTTANCNMQAITNLFQIPFQRQDLNLREISALLWSSIPFGEYLYESGSNYDKLNHSLILVSITSIPSWVPPVLFLKTFAKIYRSLSQLSRTHQSDPACLLQTSPVITNILILWRQKQRIMARYVTSTSRPTEKIYTSLQGLCH